VWKVSALVWQLDVAAGLALTLASSIAFGDSMEFLGSRLGLRSGLLGSVVTPILTSVPELVVILYALIAYHGSRGSEVAEGTVIGEPFLVSTLMLPLLVAFSLLRGRRGLSAEGELLMPLVVFVAIFPSVAAPELLADSKAKYLAAALLMATYVVFASVQGRAGEPLAEPFKLSFIGRAGIAWGFLQLSLSLAGLYVGAEVLVRGVVAASYHLGLSPFEVSVLLVPLATAVPESSVAFLWELRGHDSLAVGALIGEMVLYATVYPAVGLLTAPWRLGTHGIAAVAATELACAAAAYEVWRGRISWVTMLLGLGGLAAYLAMIWA
jgi:cation:H+ antiporter